VHILLKYSQSMFYLNVRDLTHKNYNENDNLVNNNF
jgi:hypothetical protein